MKIIKALTLLLLTIFLTSCSDPKAELTAQNKELSAKIESLKNQKKELLLKNSKISDEAEIFILEAYKQHKSQEMQSMAFVLQQGFSGITGNAASLSEVASHVDQENSREVDSRIFDKKIQMLRDEHNRNTKEVSKISEDIRDLKKKKKAIQKKLKDLELAK